MSGSKRKANARVPARNNAAIAQVIAHPLRAKLPKAQVTGQRAFPTIDILVVEIVTADGLIGFGESLARTSSPAYAGIVEKLLAPAILGADSRDIAALHRRMMRILSGRAGGMVMEAIAGIDIALWDIAGKRAGLPIHALLGGEGRRNVAAYASSINWASDAEAAEECAAAVAAGFKTIKVKVGQPVRRAAARVAAMRKTAGDAIALGVDANWTYALDDAVALSPALRDSGYLFFEEPIVPEDIAGYRHLRSKCAVMLAAGESDFTVWQAADLVAERLVGIIQPDVARAGGITETRRIAELAHAHHVDYAPHIGWSGAICAAASLQLAAAMPAFRFYECMVFDNPLRDALLVEPVGEKGQLVAGELPVPQGPGLGVEVDRAMLRRLRAN